MTRVSTFLLICLTAVSAYSQQMDHQTSIYPSKFAVGDAFPGISFARGLETVDLNTESQTNPIIVVRFLGYGCSHCVQQLTYLNSYADQLKRFGIRVYAFSSDDEQTCAELMNDRKYVKDVMHVFSDTKNIAADLISAIRTDSNKELDLHASMVVYKGKVLFSILSEEPYMDVERLVGVATSAKGEKPQGVLAHAIDRYLSQPFTVSVIAGPSQGINAPIDLDFNKSPLHPNDLWVVTTSTPGHAMAIVHNAGMPSQSVRLKKDSRASHFMWRTMGIAMGSNGTFATAQNGEHGNGDPFYQFMGPTLWSSDTAVFASRYQAENYILASHLDMLHQSPIDYGIAHDTANVFWVSDGFNGDVCSYNYNDPHEVGGTDHRDGVIRRYVDVEITRSVRGRPAHLAFDQKTKWLYFVDPGGNRIMRLDTRSGRRGANLFPPNESWENLAEFYEMVDATVEVVVAGGIGEPVGIEVVDNRLLVGDRTSGRIYVYSIEGDEIVPVGSVSTNAAELLGLCVGPDGNIWFVDRAYGTVNVLVTEQTSSLRALSDFKAVSKTDELQFVFSKTDATNKNVRFIQRSRPVYPHGFGAWSLYSDVGTVMVNGISPTTITVDVNIVDTTYATEIQIEEYNDVADGGVRASTIVVPKWLRRAVVDDATMETFNISDAVAQTERPGYAFLRSDVFNSVVDSLTDMQTVLWNGGSFGEFSVTDDAVLNALIAREVEVFLVADDPCLLRGDLPGNSQFFNRFGVAVVGADVALDDTGQRLFDGVVGDSVSGELRLVDCQLPRLEHARGISYVPNVEFRLTRTTAKPVLTRNQGEVYGCVRYDQGFYRTIILGINAARFLDGNQRTTLLRNGLIWLEAFSNVDTTTTDTSDTDTTTSVHERIIASNISMRVAQNPVSDRTLLNLEGEANSLTVGVYSVGGQRVIELPIQNVHGLEVLSLDVRGLASGTYFVLAHSEHGVSHLTIVKQ